MHHNRITRELPPGPPQTPAPTSNANTFVVFPLPCLATPAQWQMQQQIYQWAFEQAQAVVRPSILERDLLGVWN